MFSGEELRLPPMGSSRDVTTEKEHGHVQMNLNMKSFSSRYVQNKHREYST